MTYDPGKHHRRSIRLPAYDYAQAGAYFVTICTQNRECAFGDVVEGRMVLNGPGKMVEAVWRELPQHYPGVEVDTFVIMPNHLHGIIILLAAGPAHIQHVGAGPRARPEESRQPQGVVPSGRPRGVAPTMSLPDVVQRFKSLTTAKYRREVSQHGWRPFRGRLWQRNYYEHVIRDDDDLDRIRCYIAENPLRWDEDPENPVQSAGDHGGSPLRSNGGPS